MIGLPEDCKNLRNIRHKHFKLKSRLGHGNFGEVYKAILYEKGRKLPVAVKVLKKQSSSNTLIADIVSKKKNLNGNDGENAGKRKESRSSEHLATPINSQSPTKF